MDIHDTPNGVKGGAAPLWGNDQTPANTDAERALLGALLISNNAIDRAQDLKAEHFFHTLHADIFDAIAAEIFAGRTVTATTLAPRFRGVNVGNNVSGAQYLGSLISAATTVLNVADYARTIIDHAQRRALIVVAEDLAARAWDTSDAATPAEMIEDAERALYRVATRGGSSKEVSLGEAAASAMAAVSDAHRIGGRIDGTQTGFLDLDKRLGGLGNGNLIIIAGRPSMGKTALATNIATNVAKGLPWTNPETGEVEAARPVHVHFFSQEMTASELAMRQIAGLSGISSHDLRRGSVNEVQFREAKEAADRLARMSMTIDETGGLTIGALSTRARREKRKHNTGLIVIDYLQLMQGSGSRGASRTQELTEITTGLKALAKELHVPVIALSQLSRQVELREDKRPQLSDLRESGSIEQDADVVLFVFREEYYVERAQPPAYTPEHVEWMAKLEAVRGLAEVIAAKQRHGPLGTTKMAFDGGRTSFFDLAQDGGGR